MTRLAFEQMMRAASTLSRGRKRWTPLPTKTIAYLAAGKPIVMAAEGAAADLIDISGSGITVPPENPLALAEALKQLAASSKQERHDMGQRGRQYFLSHFSKRVVMPRYETLLLKIVNLPQGF